MNNKTELINAVLYSMMDDLSKDQLNTLKNQLNITLYNYDISQTPTETSVVSILEIS